MTYRVDFTDERLPNGLRLLVVEDHTVPAAGVSIAYDVGGRHDPPGRAGFAHLFEHVMFQGSRNVGKMEHFERLNAVGAIVNGGTSQDMTIYHESLPPEHLDLALYLESDRLGTLLDTLTQEKLDNQRDVVRNERAQGSDNVPYGLAGDMLGERVFPPGHPYHHTLDGAAHDLDHASLEDVRTFFRAYYAVNNATLSLVGDIDRDRARELVARHFGGIAPNPSIPPPPDMTAPASIGGPIREVVPDRVSLSRVFLAYRGPAVGQELRALQVAIAVLARGPWSRLPVRLVRQRELAQDAGLSIDPSVGPSMTGGQATARAGVDPARLEEAYVDVVEGLPREPITADELARARAGLERAHLEGMQTVMDRSNNLGIYTYVWGSPGAVNEDLERVLAVTADEAMAAAAKYLRADNRVTLVFVPEGEA